MDLTDNISHLNILLVNALVTASIFQMIFRCSPHSYLEAIVTDQKNERLDDPITLGSIIKGIGIWFFMDSVVGNSQKSFFV